MLKMKKFFSIIFGLSLGITTMFNTSAQVLDIRKQDDPILREISTEVTSFDGQLETLIDDMSDTLIKNKAAGIAAPQVGKKLRIFLVEYDGEITEYVNPTITVRKGEQTCIEGCLSVTDVLLGEVIRPKYIKGKAFDKYGEEFEFEAEGDEAAVGDVPVLLLKLQCEFQLFSLGRFRKGGDRNLHLFDAEPGGLFRTLQPERPESGAGTVFHRREGAAVGWPVASGPAGNCSVFFEKLRIFEFQFTRPRGTEYGCCQQQDEMSAPFHEILLLIFLFPIILRNRFSGALYAPIAGIDDLLDP